MNGRSDALAAIGIKTAADGNRCGGVMPRFRARHAVAHFRKGSGFDRALRAVGYDDGASNVARAADEHSPLGCVPSVDFNAREEIVELR